MKKIRGSALVSTLFFVVLIVMFAVLIAKQGRDAIVSGALLSQSRQAEEAALSGIEYVKGRLYYDKSWGTGALGISFTDTASHTKMEFSSDSCGKYLKGFIGDTEDGRYSSEFSIRFSSSAPNSRNVGFFKDFGICEYGSVNNLSGDSDIDSGYLRKVPAGTFYVVSKGVCGNCVKYAEAMFESAGPSVISGGTTIGGQISISGSAALGYSYSDEKDSVDADGNPVYNKFLYVKRSDGKAAGQITSFTPVSSAKSNGNSISVNCEGVPMKNLINSDADHRVIINSSNFEIGYGESGDLVSYANIPQEEKPEGLSHNMQPSVEASDIGELAKFEDAIKDYNTVEKKTGGAFVYVRDKTGNVGAVNEWRYINGASADNALDRLNSEADPVDPNELFASSGGPAPIKFGNDSAVTNSDNTSSVSRDRTVTVSGNVRFDSDTSFLIVDKTPDGYSNLEENDLSSIDFSVKDGSVICDGNLSIGGEVTGTGKIFANGDASFNAGSSLETKPQSGVAVWAAKDVNIAPPQNISNETLHLTYDMDGCDYDYRQGDNQQESVFSQESFANIKVISTDSPSNYYKLYVNGDEKLEFYQTKGSRRKASEFIYKDEKGKEKIVSKTTEVSLGDISIDNSNYRLSIKPILTTNGNVTDFQLIFSPFKKDGKVDSSEAHQSKIYFDVNSSKLPKGYGSSSNSSVGSKNDKFEFAVTDTKKKQYFSDSSLASLVNADGELIGSGTNNSQSSVNNEQIESFMVTDIRAKVKSAPTSLKGTIYSAGGNININGGNSEFDILGAIIANDGNLFISDVGRIMLIYDPDYVPFFKDKGIITGKIFERLF